jgi:hypothetical protein
MKKDVMTCGLVGCPFSATVAGMFTRMMSPSFLKNQKLNAFDFSNRESD